MQKSLQYCKDIEFTIFSPLEHVKLLLYPEGPCNDTGISQRQIDINFLPCSCAVGFQPSEIKMSVCECICDSKLFPFVTVCNVTTDSFTRTVNFWIMYINTNVSETKAGYLLHPNCPFDYCHSPSQAVNVNLNEPTGADAQFVSNLFGLLCSICHPGLSLSLGSSRCIVCPSYWPALFTVTVLGVCLAGIILVVFIMLLNLTVATGTLNGLIFYANIVAANSSVFMPFDSINFHTVFIDWMNLELGFDPCLFDGMDAYAKVWLQIAFSAYLIINVVLIILISERSTKFAHLIGRRNPVATLSTLILLSYTKLLHNTIAILSFAILKYPDGTQEVVWLPDATVQYLKGKHIPLFLVSLCILLIVIVYTCLLFSWQWLLKLPNKKIFRWIWNTRITSFMDTYHAPYTFENRYWTGLLLLLRVVLYLVASMNVSGEPSINILAVNLLMTCLLILIGFLKKPIYKNMLINTLEMACYFNITVLGIAKYHVLETKSGDRVLAYTSVSTSFAMFIIIVFYNIIKVTHILDLIKCTKSNKVTVHNDLQVHLLDGNKENEVIPVITFSEVAIGDKSQEE